MLDIDLVVSETFHGDRIKIRQEKKRQADLAKWKKEKARRVRQILQKLKNLFYKREQRKEEKTRPLYCLRSRLYAKWRSVTVEQVLAKFGESPTCYLTGLPIDYNDGSTYHLEHVKPKSKGGESLLDNMQLAHPMANLFKGVYSREDFINLCHLVVAKHPRNI